LVRSPIETTIQCAMIPPQACEQPEEDVLTGAASKQRNATHPPPPPGSSTGARTIRPLASLHPLLQIGRWSLWLLAGSLGRSIDITGARSACPTARLSARLVAAERARRRQSGLAGERERSLLVGFVSLVSWRCVHLHSCCAASIWPARGETRLGHDDERWVLYGTHLVAYLASSLSFSFSFSLSLT